MHTEDRHRRGRFNRRRGRNQYHTYTATAGIDYQFGPKNRIGHGFLSTYWRTKIRHMKTVKIIGHLLGVAYWFNTRWGWSCRLFREVNSKSPKNTTTRTLIVLRSQPWTSINSTDGSALTSVPMDWPPITERLQIDDETNAQNFGRVSIIRSTQHMDLMWRLRYSVVEGPARIMKRDDRRILILPKRYQSGSIGLNASSG